METRLPQIIRCLSVLLFVLATGSTALGQESAVKRASAEQKTRASATSNRARINSILRKARRAKTEEEIDPKEKLNFS